VVFVNNQKLFHVNQRESVVARPGGIKGEMATIKNPAHGGVNGWLFGSGLSSGLFWIGCSGVDSMRTDLRRPHQSDLSHSYAPPWVNLLRRGACSAYRDLELERDIIEPLMDTLFPDKQCGELLQIKLGDNL